MVVSIIVFIQKPELDIGDDALAPSSKAGFMGVITPWVTTI